MAILWGIILFALSSVMAHGQDDSKALSEAHLKNLRNEINQLQSFMQKAQDDHQQLVDRLRKSDQAVANSSKKIEELKAALKEERRTLKKSQAQYQTLRQQQNKRKRTLSSVLLASYKIGQQPQLKLLLNQQDPASLSRQLHYLQYLSQAHQEQIEQYKSTLLALNHAQQTLSESEKQLQTKLSKLTQQQQALKNTQSNQRQHAQVLNKTLKNSDEKLKRLQQDRQQLIDLLGKVEDVFLKHERSQESRPFVKLKGKLPSPSKVNPQKLFGKTQHNGKQKWQGWLYKGKAGSPVYAVHHGRVVFSDWLRGFGLLTIVDHGQGYMSLYARNQALLSAVGEWVESGDMIAKQGRSGGYQQDALYFEIRHKGQPINPKRWLRR